MRISLQQMLIKLADLSPKSYCEESFVFNFRAVRFWDGSLDPNVLYIVSASQLPPEPSEINGASKLLCIMDAPLHSDYTDGGVHLITFPAAASPIAIYNCLSTHLVDLFDGSASLQTLISRLVRGNFDEILISISKILRKSVILFAFNLQMISSAAYFDDRPSCWDSVHKLGYYPNFYNLASKLATGELLIYTKNRQLLSLRQMPAEGGEIFAPIIADNLTREILGYIFFYEPNCDAIVDNSESLAFICHTLSWRMWKITHTRDRSHALLTDTLYSVLDGAITDDQVITSAMTRAGMRQRGFKLLIVVSSGSGSPDAAVNPAEKWPELFKDIWTDSFSFLYNGDLILIVHAESPDALMDQTLRKLQERLQLSNCCAGVSDVFQDVDHYFLNHYTRALAAVQVAALRGGHTYARYSAVALEHIAHFGTAALSRAVVDPRLLQLMKNDQVFSTDYLETLRYYWACDKDVPRTCAVLHIHRSTLFYRLKKIREILGDHFQGHDQYLQLCISITILEKLGEVPHLRGIPPRDPSESTDRTVL